MNLTDLSPAVKKQKRTRVGRGTGSGMGKTSGKGHKGFNSRSGISRRPGTERGQQPLIRRIPKRGFNNYEYKTSYAIINISLLNDLIPGTEVDIMYCKEKGWVRNNAERLKILGDGELTVAVKVKADKLTKSAIEKITAAKGTVETVNSR